MQLPRRWMPGVLLVLGVCIACGWAAETPKPSLEEALAKVKVPPDWFP